MAHKLRVSARCDSRPRRTYWRTMNDKRLRAFASCAAQSHPHSKGHSQKPLRSTAHCRRRGCNINVPSILILILYMGPLLRDLYCAVRCIVQCTLYSVEHIRERVSSNLHWWHEYSWVALHDAVRGLAQRQSTVYRSSAIQQRHHQRHAVHRMTRWSRSQSCEERRAHANHSEMRERVWE